jgi:hypothetical protein
MLMVAATFFFLGLSLCIFAGLVCWTMARSIKRTAKELKQANKPEIDEKAIWLELKTALADLYSRYEMRESPKEKYLRSWTGTLIICAGLCMIGILLEVEYNSPITVDRIIAGFVGPQHVSVPTVKPRAHNVVEFPQLESYELLDKR